jgi:hypothetical protein
MDDNAGREVSANIGVYGTDVAGSCPSGDGTEFGRFLSGMLAPAKFRRATDKKFVTLVMLIYENVELTCTSEQFVSKFFFKRGSFGDVFQRKPIFSQLCAQLLGFTPPRSVKDWVLPAVEDVLEGVGVDKKKTILFVNDKPMFAPQYAQHVEDLVKTHAAEYPGNTWDPEAGTVDAWKLVKELNLFAHDIPPADIDTYEVTSSKPADWDSEDEDNEDLVEEETAKQRVINYNQFKTANPCAPPASPGAKPAAKYKAAPPLESWESLMASVANNGAAAGANGGGKSAAVQDSAGASAANDGAAAAGANGGGKSAATGTSSPANDGAAAAGAKSAAKVSEGDSPANDGAAAAGAKGGGKSAAGATGTSSASSDKSKSSRTSRAGDDAVGGPANPKEKAPVKPVRKRQDEVAKLADTNTGTNTSHDTRLAKEPRDRKKPKVRNVI